LQQSYVVSLSLSLSLFLSLLSLSLCSSFALWAEQVWKTISLSCLCRPEVLASYTYIQIEIFLRIRSRSTPRKSPRCPDEKADDLSSLVNLSLAAKKKNTFSP
jgi:hypothetical protein